MTVPDGVVVPWPSFDRVRESVSAVKLARIVALPLERVTVVLAEDVFAIVAVPLVTVQLENWYPVDGVAEMDVAEPALTVTVPDGVVVPCPSLDMVSE